MSTGTAALSADRLELEKAGDGLLLKLKGAWRLAEGASDILRQNVGRGILELGKGRI